MTINKWFQGGRTIGRRSEQNLLEDLIIESIQMYGYEMLYLPRTFGNFDKLFLEDNMSSFLKSYAIEMYLETVNGFENADMMAKFGLQLNDNGSFIVSKSRWIQAVARSGDSLLPNRPTEGDILYFAPTNSLFEIVNVDAFDAFYQLGKLYTYKLKVELFQHSAEVIKTGVPDVDGIKFPFGDMVEEDYSLSDQTGIVLQDENGEDLISADYDMVNIDPTADNSFFKENNTTLINFNVNNPFGNVSDQ